MNNEQHSRMFYHGTRVEVMLGDKVIIKRWFKKNLNGVVCYISGISVPHPDLEEGGPQWAIQLEDGALRVAGYEPENKYGYGQPKRHIVFVCRGEAPIIDPKKSFE